MHKQQIAIALHAALLIGALFFVVPTLTQWDSRAGFLFSLTFYWLFFCLPVIGWHALAGNDGRLFSEKLPWRDWWIIPLLLVQVLLVALITFVPNTSMLTHMWTPLWQGLFVGMGLIGCFHMSGLFVRRSVCCWP